MEPTHPLLSAWNEATEPWRLFRLARLDGRVRELMRALTPERGTDASALGEVVWARHVLCLHDERGHLVAEISDALAASPWLVLVAAVLRKAWDGEDETEVTLLRQDGDRIAVAELLAPPAVRERGT